MLSNEDVKMFASVATLHRDDVTIFAPFDAATADLARVPPSPQALARVAQKKPKTLRRFTRASRPLEPSSPSLADSSSLSDRPTRQPVAHRRNRRRCA
jgi:hypothetical protein